MDGATSYKLSKIGLIGKDEINKEAKKKKKKQRQFTTVFVKSITWVNGIVISLILLSLVLKSFNPSMMEVMTVDTVTAIAISVISIGISIVLVVLIGIPVAYVLATKKGKVYKYLEGLICFPVILPPTVAGLALLMTFGKRGLIGQFLYRFGLSIPFTFTAVILVQIFIVSPYFIEIVKNEFKGIDISIVEAAKVFGAGEKELILKIYVPLARKAIMSGIILSSLRGLGEFGATMMFAGNMIGKTQTISLRIYSLYQIDVNQAVNLAVIQLGIVMLLFGIMKLVVGKGDKF